MNHKLTITRLCERLGIKMLSEPRPPSKQSLWIHGSIKELSDTELINSRHKFITLMEDDLNTSGALSVLFELAKPLRSLTHRLKNEGLDQLNVYEVEDRYLDVVGIF